MKFRIPYSVCPCTNLLRKWKEEARTFARVPGAISREDVRVTLKLPESIVNLKTNVTPGKIGQDGMCIDLKSRQFPKRVCYCSAGFFGRYCQKRFQPSKSDTSEKCFNYNFPEGTKTEGNNYKMGLFDPSCYFKRITSLGDILYWRIVNRQTEIEFVTEFSGMSWLGVGWRPSGANKSCRAFPKLNQQTAPTKKPGYYTSYMPPGPLHPMDCMDMVIGAASGLYYRVADYYTRDRSTPMLDEEFPGGGKDSLSAAFGFQSNSTTYIMFRKPIKSSDFYETDVLKYHGSVNRGVFPKLNALSSTGRHEPHSILMIILLICLACILRFAH